MNISQFALVLLAVSLGTVRASGQCDRQPTTIYRSGWSPEWLTGAHGAAVDETRMFVRSGTSSTLSALTKPFAEFSLVTVGNFSTDSIVDVWLQGTAVQSAAVYLIESNTGTVSDSIFLSDISPESIAAQEVMEDRYRIIGPDTEDWFRLSINAKALQREGQKNTVWDSIVFQDVGGVGTSVYIAEARILPNQRSCLKEITPESGCIGSVCNSDISGVVSMSTSVPLYGFGPLQAEAAEIASAYGAGSDISVIAKLTPGTTYSEVAKLCANLQGMNEDSVPADVFARGMAMSGMGEGAPGVAYCQIEPAVAPLAVEQAQAPVEWPIVHIVVSSYGAMGEVRDMSAGFVSYFDRDGTAYANAFHGPESVNEVTVEEEIFLEQMYGDGNGYDGNADVEQMEGGDFAEQADVIDSTAKPAGCPGIPWGLSRIDQDNLPLDGVYNPGFYTGRGVHVYVLDTGLNMHSDFEGRIGEGVDCSSGTCRSGSYSDGTGHGTHVAATIGGTCYGVAKGVTIHPVKVLGNNGSGSYTGIINGIKWATENARRNGWRGVINMSLGGGASASLDSATNLAVSQGMVVAVAAGNENGADACTKSPSRASEALTTGATTKSDRWASYSNVGRCLDIWAPGSRVASASYTDYYGYIFKDGTSMASPHVAGGAALFLEKYPSASPNQVRDGLLSASVQKNIYRGSTTALLQVTF
jgi:subtilisin family serine protease